MADVLVTSAAGAEVIDAAGIWLGSYSTLVRTEAERLPFTSNARLSSQETPFRFIGTDTVEAIASVQAPPVPSPEVRTRYSMPRTPAASPQDTVTAGR